MIVTFRTNVHRDVTYLGDVATELLRLMGRRGAVPSAMYAEDIPEALSKLNAAIEQREKSSSDIETDSPDDDAEHNVSLKHRAIPLIDLLEAAYKAGDGVMWEN